MVDRRIHKERSHLDYFIDGPRVTFPIGFYVAIICVAGMPVVAWTMNLLNERKSGLRTASERTPV